MWAMWPAIRPNKPCGRCRANPTPMRQNPARYKHGRPVTATSGGEAGLMIKLSGETPPGASEPESSAVSAVAWFLVRMAWD